MKKAKKLISLLLALTMLLSIIPMAMAANAAFTLGQTSCNDAVLTKANAPAGAQQNKNLSEGSVSKNIGEMGLYKRLPRVTTANADYLPVEYIVTDDAVSVSDPDVIGELEFSLQPGVVSGWPGTYPCIEFDYKALKAGTTNVSLKFFYKFDSRSGLSGWYYDLVTFTVNVSATEVQKPDKPTVSDVERFRNYVNSTSSSKGAVYMWCDTYDHHAWFSYITDVDDAYTLGEVVANDGTVLSKGTYPWVCVMTLDANKYLNAYNHELGGKYGTHYLKDGQSETETAIWYWNASLAKWQFRGSEAPVYIDITHDKPVTEETYVLHYDANGGEGAPASQTTKSNTGKATFTVSSAIPTRDGYTFLGWADKADATAVQYHGGDKITLTKDIPTKTIYAVWEAKNPQPPLIPAPSYDDLKSAIGQIQVKDVSTPSCGTENYDLIDNTESEPFNWTKTARADQPGKYDVTIKTAPYVAKYNSEKTKTHELNNANQTTLKLVISYENNKWVLDDGLRVIEVKHSEQTPPVDKPNPPTEDNLLGLYIAKVYCAMPANHGSEDFTYLSGTLDTSRTYTVDENGFCTVYLHVAPYVASYNGHYTSSSHARRAEDPTTVPVTLVYNTERWEVAKEGDAEALADIPVYCAETPVEPAKPTALDGSFAIVCKNNEATHAHKADYIATPSQYTISDVQTDEQGYYVTATVTVAPNLVAYNTLTGAEHRLVNEQDATLTITFRYDTEVTGDENRKWEQQGEVPVVEVICKPKAPTADDLKKLEMAVQVKCVVDASQQHTAAYGLLGEYDEDYFVGEPRKDGDDWLCDINYYPERYVAEFNTTFQNLKHVQNDEKIVPVTLIWDGGSWQLKTQGRVHVTEEYTVTYTDGVDGEEVFADQVYSDLRKDSTTPAFNGTPTRTGYTFAGWEPEVAETVTETVTYAAKWTPVEPTHDDIFKALNGLVTVTCINRFWKDGNKNMDCGQGQYAAKAGIAGQDYTLVKGENAGTWVVTFPVTNFVKSFKQDPAHNLYTKDTLSWYIRWEDNAWTSEPVESGVDDLVKLTHAPTDWREVAKIATGGKSDCIHTSCVNGETGVCDYGITVPFVYFNTDVVSVEPEDGVPGSYIATFKVDRYIDTCAKACNDKNFPDAPRTHKLLTQETVQWRLYATPEADEKIGNNVLNHVWEAEPVEAGKDDVCTIAHNWVVTFNPDNGEPAFTQNVEYEGKATEPAPEKTGYTFDGWYLDEAEEPFDFDTIITSDITLTAKWHVTPHNIYAYARLNSYFAPLTTNEFDTPVTLNEATLSRLGLGSYNSLGYISIGSFTFDAMPLTDDQYFGDDAELSAVAEKLATDIALETGVSDKIAEKIAWTALYKTVNEEDMAPGYPAEAGYQLSGNLDLATVMFKANGENVTGMPEDNYVYNDVVGLYDFYFAGDTFTLPADPTREGYIFEGWSVKVLPAENDADHLDADGADDAADETLLKAGDTYTITAGGVIFTAQWEARTDTPYTVEHYLENLDGSYALDTTEPLKGTTDTTVTAAAKSYDNFTYDSTVPGTVASGNIAGDGSLVLKLFYTRNTYDYTVRHIKQLPDGSYDEANAEVETLSGKFEALAAVTAKDYGSHYPTNDAGTKQNIKIEKNLTIDVKYDLDNHTLTFETNGGSAIDPVTVRHGNAVARPADPTKDKYTFIGWYVDPEFSAEYDFATVLEADKTIYAKFELTSTPIGDIYVRYDVLHIKQLPDGSYDLANAEVEHLSAKKDTTVTAVVKDYSATHHINVNSTLSKLTDTAIQPYPGADGKPVYTILSVYYDLDFHTLTFDTMGGSRIDPVTVRHGNAVAKPKDPVNGGYIFDGWYTDKTYRTPYNFATVLTQDTTIYAKWFLIALPGVTIKKTTPKLNTSDHFAYVQGYPDGTVKPTGNITRAETAAILFRLMDEGSRKTYYSTKSGFRDVATGSWYNTYVATLNNAGVITDSSNGYFRPNEAITRAELAAMLANFTETAGAANYFNDVSARYWAANAIAICAKLGWITGYPDGSFRPDRNVTRAELMAMINRATGRAPKSADAFLPGMKTWSDNTADKWYYLDVQEATNSHSYTVKDSEKWTALNADPNWSLYE